MSARVVSMKKSCTPLSIHTGLTRKERLVLAEALVTSGALDEKAAAAACKTAERGLVCIKNMTAEGNARKVLRRLAAELFPEQADDGKLFARGYTFA